MKKLLILASLGALTVTTSTAMADHNWRKRKFVPWQEDTVYLDDDEEDGFIANERDDTEVIYLNRRQRMMDEAERDVEADLWWLENNARKKLESRGKAKKSAVKKVEAKPAAKKPVAKPKVVASKPTKPVLPKLQTASLSKPTVVAKPKPVTTKTTTSGKTIGCTAGAAVVTGYGFGEVKPKACTGATYAYTAARSGKTYEIKMTAASGEIIDVKKLN